MNNKIKIYKSKRKSIIFILTFSILLVTGIILLMYNNKISGWSFIIFSLLGLLVGISFWFDNKPQIIIDEKGITDNVITKEMIEWNAIQQVDEWYFRGQYYIRLLLDVNYKPDVIHSQGYYRIGRVYEKAGVKAVYIKTSMLDINSQQLTQLIQSMAKADQLEKQRLLMSNHTVFETQA